MKNQVRKKLKKHERARHRYLLVSKDENESMKRALKDMKINFKEVELVVRSLMERQIGRIILKVNRNDIEKIKKELKEKKIGIINVSGTLKGLLD